MLAEEQSFFDTGFVATAGAMLTAAPAAAASTEGKKKRKRRAGPKRLSAYTLFFGDRMKAVDRSGRAFRDVTGAIGAEWRGLTAEEKQVDRERKSGTNFTTTCITLTLPCSPLWIAQRCSTPRAA